MNFSDHIIEELSKIEFKYIRPNNSRGLKYKIYKKMRKMFFKNDIINLKKFIKSRMEEGIFLF